MTKAENVAEKPIPIVWGEPWLEAAYPDQDCGCPVEDWILCGISLQIHFEADGTLECFADGGDWDQNIPLSARTMEAARDEAFAWVHSLPTEEERDILRAKEADREG